MCKYVDTDTCIFHYRTLNFSQFSSGLAKQARFTFFPRSSTSPGCNLVESRPLNALKREFTHLACIGRGSAGSCACKWAWASIRRSHGGRVGSGTRGPGCARRRPRGRRRSTWCTAMSWTARGTRCGALACTFLRPWCLPILWSRVNFHTCFPSTSSYIFQGQSTYQCLIFLF